MSLLAIDSVHSGYGQMTVLENIHMSVEKGEFVVVIGPNGAGKSTLLKTIFGFVDLHRGRISFNGKEIGGRNPEDISQMGISYVPQDNNIFPSLTVLENLRCIAETLKISSDKQEEITSSLLKEFGISHLSNQGAYTLSGGERRRLEIARALVLTPQFILLDEPFAGIDPLAVLDIQRIIGGLRDRGIGVLITDHNVRETLNITDRAYIINDGKILREGTPEQLTNDDEVKKVYLGENFRLR